MRVRPPPPPTIDDGDGASAYFDYCGFFENNAEEMHRWIADDDECLKTARVVPYEVDDVL